MGRWRDQPYYIVAGGIEYCPGYYDEHAQWNNGFDCPKWGGPDQQYCCGSERHHYCCPPEKIPQKLSGGLHQHIPLIICLTIGGLVLLLVATVIFCYFCSCCLAYKRRKRLHTGLSTCTEHHLVNDRAGDFAVNYSVCPDRSFFSDIPQPPRYPADDPPPYPEEEYLSSPSEDKEPLHLSECRPHRLAGVIPLQPCGGTTSLSRGDQQRHEMSTSSSRADLEQQQQPSTSGYHVRDWRTMSRDSSFDFEECSVMGPSHFQNRYACELDPDLAEDDREDRLSPVDSLRHYRTA